MLCASDRTGQGRFLWSIDTGTVIRRQPNENPENLTEGLHAFRSGQWGPRIGRLVDREFNNSAHWHFHLGSISN
jgi:hypothetical protein